MIMKVGKNSYNVIFGEKIIPTSINKYFYDYHYCLLSPWHHNHEQSLLHCKSIVCKAIEASIIPDDVAPNTTLKCLIYVFTQNVHGAHGKNKR